MVVWRETSLINPMQAYIPEQSKCSPNTASNEVKHLTAETLKYTAFLLWLMAFLYVMNEARVLSSIHLSQSSHRCFACSQAYRGPEKLDVNV